MSLGVSCPASGHRPPAGLWFSALVLVGTLACSGTSETHTLPAVKLAMNQEVPPIFDDGELTLYEVRVGRALPILAPSEAERARLEAEALPPYPHAPWLRLGEARLQLTWTLTNLDEQPHNVEVLIDPWNEFAKYFPGLQLTNAQRGTYLPNLSGIDYLYSLEPVSAGAGSRRHGTYTFDDLDELARDFATAMNLIANPPAPLGGSEEDQDATLQYVNHAFAFQNQSDHDLLVARWVPSVVPGLVGFDVGLRTTEPAKVAIEVVAELVDDGAHKVQGDSQEGALLEPPTETVTLGSAAP